MILQILHRKNISPFIYRISKNNANTKLFDYVIVGAGTAGCLLANRLSLDPKIKVALIEAGGNDNNFSVTLPIGYLLNIGNPKTDWCFKSALQVGLGDRSIGYPRGKVIGGCSSINGMIYMRGQSNDYQNWATLLQDNQWSWKRCLPYFIKHEDYHSGPTPHHGKGGEWKINKPRVKYPILETIRNALITSGIPDVEDFNTGNNFGVSYFDVNQHEGKRWNTASGFLNPILKKRKNITLLTNHLTNKLIFDGNSNTRILGVQTYHNNDKYQIIASRQTILSAGSIGTTAILQKSGIGGKWLQDQGITKVKHHLNGVGQNLQDHLQLRLIYKVKNTQTLNTLIKSVPTLASMGFEYLLKRTGPLSMAPSQLGAFVKSQSDTIWPYFQYHIQPLSLDAFGKPLHGFDAVTMSICNIRPTSRGNIRIHSLKLTDPPKIQLNYLSTKDDQSKAVQAIRITRNIMKQQPLLKNEPEEYKPGHQFNQDQQLVKQAGLIGTTIFHPVGTCKMGLSSDKQAVVDARLRVFGMEQLRIVDASVMPLITSGNTNSPTLMIAQKAAQWILKN